MLLAQSSGIQIALALGLLLGGVALWLLHQQSRNAAAARERITQLEQRLAERGAALQEAGQRLGELHGMLKDMSLRDALTGLYNRRCLDQVLLEAWKTTSARQEPLSLLMIDVDHFKQINERYGHASGDECLREIAQRLQRHATSLGGVVARYGGEEFVAVLAHTDAQTAQSLAEVLRDAIGGSPVKTSVAPLSVTISVGVATALPGANDSLGAVLKRADAALYRAKQEGRNRVAAD